MAAADEKSRLQHLGDVEVEAVAELARLRIALRTLRQLCPGDVLVLDTLAGEANALRINGVFLAEGETVVANDTMVERLTGMAPVPGAPAAADGSPAVARR